jgi:hypothetical protein
MGRTGLVGGVITLIHVEVEPGPRKKPQVVMSWAERDFFGGINSFRFFQPAG